MKRLVSIIILIVLIIFGGCSFLEREPVDSDSKKQPPVNGSDLESANGEKESPKPSNDQEEGLKKGYAPPKGAFVLGKYPSPNKANSITAYAWSETPDGILMLDLVTWDQGKNKNSKLLTVEMLQGDRRVRREPIVWLNEQLALINGSSLLNVASGKIKSLAPSGVSEVFDYELDAPGKLLAASGKSILDLLVWVVDLDSYEITKVFTGDTGNAIHDLDLGWNAKQELFFDAFKEGEPAIYKYDLQANELVLFKDLASLVEVDTKTFEVSYFDLLTGNIKSSTEKQVLEDENEIIIAARKYLEQMGYDVGETPGKIVLTLENSFGDQAVVLYGLWSSEYSGDIVMERRNEQWEVAFRRQRFYLPYLQRFQEGAAFLAEACNCVFGEEPGRHLIGAPHWNDDIIVYVVAEYGKPWSHEYYLSKAARGWEIVLERSLKGAVVDWDGGTVLADAVGEFFDDILDGNFSKAYRQVLFEDKGLAADEFLKVFGGNKLLDYDLGELRILGSGQAASLQVWLVVGDGDQVEFLYDRINLKQVDSGQWKIVWPFDFI